MRKFKKVWSNWQKVWWLERYSLYGLLLFSILMPLSLLAQQHVMKEQIKDLQSDGFTYVKVDEPDKAIVSSSSLQVGCKLKLKFKDDWWWLEHPANDGVPVVRASEVFKRQHVQDYCADKQPQSP
jgi:hypothetical protein